MINRTKHALTILAFDFNAHTVTRFEVFGAGFAIQQCLDGAFFQQAARALGLTQTQTLRHVVLPQAFRNVTPPLLNDLVSLQKDSGLISVLGAVDAIRAAGIETAQSFNFTPYVVAGGLFVLLTIPLTRYTDWLIRKQDRAQKAQGVF